MTAVATDAVVCCTVGGGRSFLLALCCYIVGFARIGWVYYADSFNRFGPFLAMIVGEWRLLQAPLASRR